jgi:hypothetical protein
MRFFGFWSTFRIKLTGAYTREYIREKRSGICVVNCSHATFLSRWTAVWTTGNLRSPTLFLFCCPADGIYPSIPQGRYIHLYNISSQAIELYFICPRRTCCFLFVFLRRREKTICYVIFSSYFIFWQIAKFGKWFPVDGWAPGTWISLRPARREQ